MAFAHGFAQAEKAAPLDYIIDIHPEQLPVTASKRVNLPGMVQDHSIENKCAEVKIPEEKHHVIDVAPDPHELLYLRLFTLKELEQLTNVNGQSFILDLKKTPQELDETIQTYWKTFQYYRIENWIANATNILYIIFAVNTANDGITSFVHTFQPDTTIPDFLNRDINIPTAILSTLIYPLAFSAAKEAIKSTLKYAYDKPIKDKITDSHVALLTSPCSAIFEAFRYMTHKTVLYTANLTATMTEIIEIADPIKSLPAPWNWLSIIGILYFGNKYCEKYMNANYYEGLTFWRSKMPSLANEIREGYFAEVFQILFQTSGSIALKTSIFYYLAEASKNALGFWFPAPMVAALIVWHSLFVLYPETYRFYMNDKIKITDLIHEKIKPFIAQYQQENPHHTKNQLAEATQKEFTKLKNHYEKIVLQERGKLFLFKTKPHMIFPLLFRSGAGGWLGWRIGALISTELLAAPVTGSLLIAALLGGLLYRSEANRVLNQLIFEKIKLELADAGRENTVCETASEKFATLLNVANGLSNATSTIGTNARLFGANSTLTPIGIILAIEQSLNYMQLNGGKVKQTVKSLLPPSCSA